MSTHNLCFAQKYEKYQRFLFENFQFLEVKFSIHLNKHVFILFSDDAVQKLTITLLKRIKGLTALVGRLSPSVDHRRKMILNGDLTVSFKP